MDDFLISLKQGGSLYFANVTLGTPAQSLRLHIDTGSSDLWTNVANSQLCELPDAQVEQQGGVPCSVAGTYDANSSSTYKFVDNDFLIQYADQSGAQGDYATDTLSIGGAAITSQQFGIGYNSTSSEGVLGIGYPSLEVQVQNDGQASYPNVPANMVQQRLIQSNAYSLWLNDLDSSQGSILFGGVDIDKYHGELSTLPIVPIQGMYVETLITLTGASVNQNGKNTSVTTSELPSAVLLDSGSTLSYLPVDVSQNIYKLLGVTYVRQQGVAFCRCDLAQSSATVDFSFSGATISVPVSELVLQGGLTPDGSGPTGCVFGIVETQQQKNSASTFTLGDTFLRSAYVVYDIANNEISLANTNFNATSSNVVEIGTGRNSVPNATGVANAVTVGVTGTAAPVNGGLSATGTSGAATATGSSSSSSSSGSSSVIPMLHVPLFVWAVSAVAGAALIFA